MQETKDKPSPELSHFDSTGQAHMVDVGDKPSTKRIAIACGKISMLPETLAIIESGNARKGDVLGIARIAAIMAAKRTPELIPLCHPIAISKISVVWTLDKADSSVHGEVEVQTTGPTGVEMEALTAVQIGLLTIYDMCKAVDRGMRISDVQLLRKSGGKSPDWSK